MNIIKRIALFFVIIGAINWGLIGFFSFDLVAVIFGGQDAAFSRLIYGIVGISGLVSFAIYSDLVVVEQGFISGNLNYGTEFGEEMDFSDLDEYSSKDDREV